MWFECVEIFQFLMTVMKIFANDLNIFLIISF
jgi:hypothetical protein